MTTKMSGKYVRSHGFMLLYLLVLSGGMVMVIQGGCGRGDEALEQDVRHDELVISYVLGPAEGITPSYQTAIWLENEAGDYVHSILVSEYLSYGGYNKQGVCPDWVAQANWAQADSKEFDAVTMATPAVGAHEVPVDCQAAGLAAGIYQYCVQTHLVEGYNVLYQGKIAIGAGPNESEGVVFYRPEKHAKGQRVLQDVKARYIPADQSGKQ